ncbi:MAG: nucleotidyltransferase domain-containing protein [Candidatus Bathyarchaeia archaeon]
MGAPHHGQRSAAPPEPYGRLLEALLQALRGELGDRLVTLALFGSAARGEARRDGDVDLLIVAKGLPRSKLERQGIFMRAEERVEPLLEGLAAEGFQIDFSPILKTPEEAAKLSPLYLDMLDDAIIPYDEGGFFADVLERLRRRLGELGAKRIRMGKRWYWVLKEPYRPGEEIIIE